MTKRRYCATPEHDLNRRAFLQGGVATALGVSLGGFEAGYDKLWASELRRQHKSVVLFWLAGGASQFETFDPKPGRPTGGPFRAIPTATPGTHVCELLPQVATLTERMAIIRSLSTKIADHGEAAVLMRAGRVNEPTVTYPDFGTIIAKELAEANRDVPDYVSIYLATEGQRWGRPEPGFLGGGHAAVILEKSMRPENIDLPRGLSDTDHADREALRRLVSDRFARTRQVSNLAGYNNAYHRVRGLMKSDTLFNLDGEPAHVRERYGPTEFGQNTLVARRLVEAGVPMVKVSRAWWDTHADNFESHRELVGEFDQVYTAFINDLASRGLLESTLVITLSEFGRTPRINHSLGRDHFANAWSCSLAGCGIRGGALFGKTDKDGEQVADGKVGAGELTATIFKAVGIDPEKEYQLGARPIPLVNPGIHAIDAVLDVHGA
jgi:hypothetical protein